MIDNFQDDRPDTNNIEVHKSVKKVKVKKSEPCRSILWTDLQCYKPFAGSEDSGRKLPRHVLCLAYLTTRHLQYLGYRKIKSHQRIDRKKVEHGSLCLINLRTQGSFSQKQFNEQEITS
jgi:hypothetical protein